MDRIRILLLRPESDDPSPVDQSLGARLSVVPDVLPYIVIEEDSFHRDDPADLERALAVWEGKVAGVVGAMNVPESMRLGALTERLNLLCFVANNNPVVWQRRRNIFHIGMPTSQTTAAVTAALVRKSNLRRFLLLHDASEFQGCVAATMATALRARGRDARSQVHAPQDAVAIPDGWRPDLIYVVFSSERKALPIARAIRSDATDIPPGTPIVFGRSLLRDTFLTSLGDLPGEFWFVDTAFRRNNTQTENQRRFMNVMATNGIAIPTTNHAFGWDGMRFCALALKAADGNPLHAIDYLESGISLEGASGTCSFSSDNHNGRLEPGPTTLTRWTNHQLEEV